MAIDLSFGLSNPQSGPFKTHIGAWGTPDYKITEALQGWLNPKKALATSGGSNLFGPTLAPAQEKKTIWRTPEEDAQLLEFYPLVVLFC